MKNINVQGVCPFHKNTTEDSKEILTTDDFIVNLDAINGPLPDVFEGYRNHLLLFEDWIISFDSKAILELIYEGGVCRIIQAAYNRNQFWVYVRSGWQLSLDDIERAVRHCKEMFSCHVGQSGTEKASIVLAVLFPDLQTKFHSLIAQACEKLHAEFIRQAYMLEEFYPRTLASDGTDSHAESLYPPIACLVIRNMVKSDLRFLRGNPECEASYKRIFSEKMQ